MEVRRCLYMIKDLLPHIDAPLTNDGRSPLAVACMAGNRALVAALLVLGADPTLVDSQGVTCVHFACEEGNLKILKQLAKDKRVNFDGPADAYGRSPIHRAVACGHMDIMVFLLRRGADPNCAVGAKSQADDEEPSLDTPLHVAAKSLRRPRKVLLKPTRHQLMEALVLRGADPTLRNHRGDTPLHLCLRAGDLIGFWICLLRAADAPRALEVANQDGITVLEYADKLEITTSISVRLVVYLPPTARQWVLDRVIFNETLAVLRADNTRAHVD